MSPMTQAYITGVGAYLPGEPVDNEQLAARFGDGTRRDAALRKRALAANGIRTRHYAVDDKGMTEMLNEELAAHAARRALEDRGLPVSAVRMLATGTTQGDVLVPGFASMVHGRLGGGPMELLSAAGVCASGMAALKAAAMDRTCLWFLRRFVSPDAVSLLIRHFIVETNLLNFCVRNAGVPGVAEISLRPTTLADLGNHAVIEHDLNVYRVLFALGSAGVPGPRAGAGLDFGMLAVPDIDPEPRTRRLLHLDIQTALCVMNIPFAFCLTPAQYRRAVHSLRLDTSLLSVLAAVTGDNAFLGWRAGFPPVRVDSNVDVPLAVYEHAVLCECAHARLCQRYGSDMVSIER
jgi:hypothetical protein